MPSCAALLAVRCLAHCALPCSSRAALLVAHCPALRSARLLPCPALCPLAALPYSPCAALPCSPRVALPCSPCVALPCSPRSALPYSLRVALPCSPRVTLPCSSRVTLPCSPHVALPCSPHVALSCSPRVALPCSPHVTLPCSPCLALPCCPCVALPYSPRVVLPCSPHVTLPCCPGVALPLELRFPALQPACCAALPLGPRAALPCSPHVALPCSPRVILPCCPGVALALEPRFPALQPTCCAALPLGSRVALPLGSCAALPFEARCPALEPASRTDLPCSPPVRPALQPACCPALQPRASPCPAARAPPCPAACASESAAAQGASETAATSASEFATSESAASAEALHTFTLDSSAMFGLIPLSLEGIVWQSVLRYVVVVLGTLPLDSSLAPPIRSPISAASCTMHSRLLVSGLPRSLPHLPRSPAPPCLPCIKGRLRAAPHSSFLPTTAPLQTLHMDVWGPADQEHYFLLVVDDYMRYTTVFPLRSKTDVCGAVSSLPASLRSSIEMRTSSSPRNVAHQLNRVFLPETSPTLCWMGKVSDALVFRVWGLLSLVHDTTASKLSPRTLRCTFLGFPNDAPPWQFYYLRTRRVLSSHGVTFDEVVCFYRLHPYASRPVPPAPHFLIPVPPMVDPLPSQGPAPSGVSQVDPPPLVEPLEISSNSSGPAEGGDPTADDTVATHRSPCLETPPGFPPRLSSPPLQLVAVDTGAAGGGDTGGEGFGGAETRGASPGGDETGGEGSVGANSRGADSWGGASPSGGGAVGAPTTTWSFLDARAVGAGGTAGGAAGAGSARSSAPSALVAELVDFAAACRLDYAASLVAESVSASVCPPSTEGECALGTDVLEDRQEDLECFAAASPHLVSMLLALEGDPDALDILTPRSYAEAIEGPNSSQWQAAMDAEMASWKSTGTYVDEVSPPGANIVSGMWIFRVKRPPGSPPAFKARYIARGFSQRQGVDFFQTFSPTPKMTTLRVLLHVAAQRDYELHSLDFSTAFLQGSLHEEILLRRPPSFTGSFPAGTQWSLRRPVYVSVLC
ncbi:unnamed protein product [Closterium sp. NIES-54]